MDFKFKELQSALFERDGWKPLLTSMGLQGVLFVLFFIPFVMLMMLGIGMSGEPENFALGMFAIFMAICVFLLVPLSTYIQAGLYGTLKDCILGKGFSFKKYFQNGLTYFWPVLGYSILYGLIAGFIGFFIGVFGGLATFGSPELSLVIEFLIILPVGFISFLLSPILYLCVIEGNTFDHVKYLYSKHGKEFVIVAAIASFLLAIPFLGMLFSVAGIALVAYVMVLFFDFTEEVVVEQEIKEEDNQIVLEKEEE